MNEETAQRIFDFFESDEKGKMVCPRMFDIDSEKRVWWIKVIKPKQNEFYTEDFCDFMNEKVRNTLSVKKCTFEDDLSISMKFYGTEESAQALLFRAIQTVVNGLFQGMIQGGATENQYKEVIESSTEVGLSACACIMQVVCPKCGEISDSIAETKCTKCNSEIQGGDFLNIENIEFCLRQEEVPGYV